MQVIAKASRASLGPAEEVPCRCRFSNQTVTSKPLGGWSRARRIGKDRGVHWGFVGSD